MTTLLSLVAKSGYQITPKELKTLLKYVKLHLQDNEINDRKVKEFTIRLAISFRMLTKMMRDQNQLVDGDKIGIGANENVYEMVEMIRDFIKNTIP